MFGGEPIIDLLNHDRFEFVKGDVRNEADVRKALDGICCSSLSCNCWRSSLC